MTRTTKEYKNLSEVAEAFKSGELSKDEWTLIIDNDSSYLQRDDNDPEWFSYSGEGYYDIFDALGALGIPHDKA